MKGQKSKLCRKITTIRKNLLQITSAVRLNWKDYGLQRVQAGGASLAATKAIPDGYLNTMDSGSPAELRVVRLYRR